MKYRIFPTKAQTTRLNETLELCRRVYNSMLCCRSQVYKSEGIGLSYEDQTGALPSWKCDHPELATVFSQVRQNVAKRVDLAYQAFFRRVAEGDAPGYPRYKSAGCYDSITFPQWGNGCRLTDAGRLRVAKIGELKIQLHRPIVGTIKTCTLRRYGEKWFVCFSCEIEAVLLPPSGEAIGIDVGIEKPSKARKKAKRIVRRVHERIKNKRSNFLHQESRRIVDRFGTIALEDLAVRNRSRRPKPKKDDETGQYLPNGAVAKSGLNKSILDAGWSHFRAFLLFKAERAGREVILVNPAYTSADCSQCGWRVAKDLDERVHRCPNPECGLVMDRDTNAARNILSKAVGLHSRVAEAA